MKRVIMHHIFNIWQESWSQQMDNKLHSVKPVIGAWPVMPLRRTDVKLTRLRIGHTRFTHRHLLFGERAPECYLRCSVRPYIPNPLRCFQCQRFGHSKPTCRGKPTCARCGAVGHDSGECNGPEKCVNCKGDHPSYSRSCSTWNLDKEIITVKIKNRLTYPEARLAVTNRTPIQGLSYAAVAKKVTTSSGTQTSPVTIIDNSKEKAPEQPSQKHSPRKDNKKIIVKPKTTLKKKPGKNVSLKIAREANSLYESTPVSKRSRRRKTSQTSDAMDTDVNPSDTDYVIALQETFLKSCHTAKIRRYGCVRKDTEGSSVSGGVCIFTSLDIPSSALSLHTSLQAVAVRIHSTSLFTVCCLYLPPNVVIRQQDLNDLVDQLPAPFVILGDFNGHSTLWGSVKTNHRGRQIEQVLSDHCLCLLNHEEPTHFHEPTRSFHTLDLAICSPSLLPILNFSVEKDLYNSDHFPVVLSNDYDAGGKTFPPRYSYSRAEWALFSQLAVISDAMVKTESVDTAVQDVTNVLIDAADLSIPKSSSHSFQRYKPWWNADCQTAYKNQRKLWGTFRRYPTTENLIAFKRAKALARRIRRQCQRESWIKYVSSITSSTTSQQLWRKVKAANGLYRDFSIPILETSTALYSSPLDVANLIGKTFASVSSSDSYRPAFQATKNRLERTPINFRCRQPLPYNCDFDMFELKRALSSAHNTSPGPDGISYVLLRHLSADSLVSLLYLFNRIWREQVYPTQWQEAIVIPILKPGKDPKNPLSYRPIALTSCLCKTLERMVNARLVYQLEKNKCIPLFQSGFRKGRSTLDNIITLENKIRNAFVRRNHLVSIFFDIEKAYDRTWRYGILRTLFDFGFRGNLPTFIKKFLNLRTFRGDCGTLSAPPLPKLREFLREYFECHPFICHISHILNVLSPSIQASLYVDDLQISCEGSDMRMIERQLQTAVNNILKWCDTNGHSISASKSCCVHFCRKRGIHPDPDIRIRDIQIPVVPDVRFLGVIFDRRLTFLPYILQLRKRCEKSLNFLKVLSNTSWGADRTSLLRVYQAIVLSRIEYGCVVYGSACNSTLKKLDPVHHMALRICSGAFRTSPVQSLYVNCHQLPLDLRRRKLSLAFYFKILSVPSHPLQNVYMSTSMKRLYDARPSNIRPFMDRMKLHISELDLPNARHFLQHFHCRSCRHLPCTSPIDSTMPRKYCIYTDSMSVLEALENYHDRCHPVVCTILDLTSRLYSKGFDIVFCWLPSHVGIIGNEQADSAAKSATTHLPLAVPLSDMKRVIMHHIFKIWQESWSQQLDNKLHSVKPVIEHGL
ncbi:probable RNA-directed DNA polymerase from transposon X-element [Trichonephila clavipes]|nr:probable RNA-directed DNA polymerase from transposon X-element [Trichonephila clavipes]